MPTCTQRGLSTSSWEQKYLNCRFRKHRNKIAAARSVIDSLPPERRPHVEFKKKKALAEELRQFEIFQENLRLVSKTTQIMGPVFISKKKNSSVNGSFDLSTSSTRSTTVAMKKSNHIVLSWFLRKFDKYIPWWAQVNY